MRYCCLLLLALFSCEAFDPTFDFRVDPVLNPAVESFFQEAEKRGITLPRNNLHVSLGRIVSYGVYNDGPQPSIVINAGFAMSHLETEQDRNFLKLVVWHELGHWTGQDHRGGVSVMNTGDWFNGPGDFVGTVQKYNSSPAIAEAITDELFDNIPR